jgi:hypothetical protein
MAFDKDSKGIFLNYYNKVLEEIATQTVVDENGNEVPDEGQITGLPNQVKIDASKERMRNRPQPTGTPAPSTVSTGPAAPAVNGPRAPIAPAAAGTSWMKSLGDSLRPSTGPAAPAAPTATATTTAPVAAPATGAPKTAPEGLLASTRMNLLGANQPVQTFSQYKAATEPNNPYAPTRQNTIGTAPGTSGFSGYANDSTANKFDKATNQPIGSTAAAGAGFSPEQMAAFEKTHGSPYNPNSSMDKRKMAQMTGQAAVSKAMPGGSNKLGQVKPSVPIAGAASNTVQNSALPGVAGTASNVIGRTGDSIENFFKGQLGKGAQQRPTTPPPAPATQTKTTQAPKAKPTNVNSKVR